MILDSLTHVTPDGRWFDTACDASEARLLRELDAAGVQQAVVVALAGYIPNDFVLDVCRRHPERLIPAASFNPAACASEAEAARTLRATLRGGPFRALKLHPRLNRYDPLDPRCLAVLEEIAAWDPPLPVWICSWLRYRGGALRKPVVDTFHELAGRFPTLPLVIAHAGGTEALHLTEALRDCPNVLLDLSFTLHRYQESSVGTDLRFLLQTFDRRLVFGSDFPEVNIPEAVADLRRLGTGVAQEKLGNVWSANLQALLALGER
jgi:predicted TIM-barrel fold metal-dependent hydrolase